MRENSRENSKDKKKKIIVLVDYENIAKEAVLNGKVVNFEKLAELCRSMGQVVVSVLFVPEYQLSDKWFETAWERGFFPMATPSRLNESGRAKQYRTADTMMIDFGSRMAEMNDVDEIVIVSNDGDFVTLVNRAQDKGKKISLVASDNVARVMERVVDMQYPLPMIDN